MMRPTDDLTRIAEQGGGFTISAKLYTVNDLSTIAAAASRGGARIHVTDAKKMAVNDLTKIATAGKGSVIFDL